MLQDIVCRTVELLGHCGSLQLVMLQLLVVELLALHGHWSQGEGHGLDQLSLTHLTLSPDTDGQVGLVEEYWLADTVLHHGHLGQRLRHAGRHVGRGHPRRGQAVPCSSPTAGPGGGGDGLRVLGFAADLGRLGHRYRTRPPQLSAVDVGS